MKTVFITTSPKKHHKLSNSAYIAYLTRMMCSDSEHLVLQGAKDYAAIHRACKEADSVVLAMPLYADGIPAHVLEFLQASKEAAKEWKCKVYVICCCGFYEGRQTHILLKQIGHWCSDVGLEYGGGLGVGATEMIGAIRFTNLFACVPIGLLTAVFTAIFKDLHSAIISGMISFAITLLLYLLWTSGVFYHAYRFGKKINKSRCVSDRFTTVWFCGRYLFTFFASLFWVIRAIKNFVSYHKMWYKVDVSDSYLIGSEEKMKKNKRKNQG